MYLLKTAIGGLCDWPRYANGHATRMATLRERFRLIPLVACSSAASVFSILTDSLLTGKIAVIPMFL